MNMLKKQLRSDFGDMFQQGTKLCAMTPIIFCFMLLTGGAFSDPQSFVLLMALLALPAGYLTLGMTRVLIALPACIGMGSTRGAFYVSNFITSLVSFFICTEFSLLVTAGLVFFVNRPLAAELAALSVSPTKTILPSLCLNVLAIGLGTLLGMLMQRFGRKVLYIATIVLVILGGVAGGVTVMLLNNTGFFSISSTMIGILLAAGAAVGLLLYGFAHRAVRSFYI